MTEHIVPLDLHAKKQATGDRKPFWVLIIPLVVGRSGKTLPYKVELKSAPSESEKLPSGYVLKLPVGHPYDVEFALHVPDTATEPSVVVEFLVNEVIVNEAAENPNARFTPKDQLYFSHKIVTLTPPKEETARDLAAIEHDVHALEKEEKHSGAHTLNWVKEDMYKRVVPVLQDVARFKQHSPMSYSTFMQRLSRFDSSLSPDQRQQYRQAYIGLFSAAAVAAHYEEQHGGHEATALVKDILPGQDAASLRAWYAKNRMEQSLVDQYLLVFVDTLKLFVEASQAQAA